jgi:hypothetical protein
MMQLSSYVLAFVIAGLMTWVAQFFWRWQAKHRMFIEMQVRDIEHRVVSLIAEPKPMFSSSVQLSHGSALGGSHQLHGVLSPSPQTPLQIRDSGLTHCEYCRNLSPGFRCESCGAPLR